MKRTLLFTAIAMAFGWCANAQNLILNGDFETLTSDALVYDAFEYWGDYGHSVETTAPYAGANSAKMNQGGSALKQTFAITPGDYDYSAFIKTETGAVTIKAVFKDAITNTKLHASSGVSATAWTEVSGTFNVPEGTSSVFVIFWKGDGTEPAYIDDVTLTASTPTAISSVKEESVSIAPNPSNGTFKISGSSAIASYAVYNTSGQLVKQAKGLAQNEASVELDNVTSGIYMVKVVAVNGETAISKVVVK